MMAYSAGISSRCTGARIYGMSQMGVCMCTIRRHIGGRFYKGASMSHEVTRIIPKKERCAFCHREATLLCDMPVAEVCTSIDFKSYVQTCDKNLCEKCTTRVGAFDFCPDCVRKIKTAKKGLG